MFKFTSIRSFISRKRTKDQTTILSSNVAPSIPHELSAIQAHEAWLQETPRTSMEIATQIFGIRTPKEFEMTFFDSFPALEEAGYRAFEGIEQGFENLVWVKA